MPMTIELTDQDVEYLKRGNKIIKVVTDGIVVIKYKERVRSIQR